MIFSSPSRFHVLVCLGHLIGCIALRGVALCAASSCRMHSPGSKVGKDVLGDVGAVFNSSYIHTAPDSPGRAASDCQPHRATVPVQMGFAKCGAGSRWHVAQICDRVAKVRYLVLCFRGWAAKHKEPRRQESDKRTPL